MDRRGCCVWRSSGHICQRHDTLQVSRWEDWSNHNHNWGHAFYNAWRIPCKQHKQAAVHQHSQQSPTDFCEQSTVFDTQSASTADVVSAWENAASLCLNNGRPREGLDSLRHKHFCEKVATSTSQVEPQSLPPTSAAAKHHSFCVYYQVQRKENCRWKMKGHLPWTNWVTNQLIWCTVPARRTAAPWGAHASGSMTVSGLLHVETAKDQGVQIHLGLLVMMKMRHWRFM